MKRIALRRLGSPIAVSGVKYSVSESALWIHPPLCSPPNSFLKGPKTEPSHLGTEAPKYDETVFIFLFSFHRRFRFCSRCDEIRFAG
jgi:hypothetical protein